MWRVKALKYGDPYCKVYPTEKQKAFYELDDREVFFGGAAGGGKSVALLMAALKYVRTPGYAALILRKDFSRLQLAGGLIPRSHEWLQNTDAQWVASRRQWIFPIAENAEGPPATIMFGYLSRPLDKFRYASSEFQYIAFDELTDFSEEDYLFLFSRLRRIKRCPVPLRMRSASNPGGMGHGWVKERFIPERRVQGPQSKVQGRNEMGTLDFGPGTFERPLPPGVFPKYGRLYVPSRIADNPYLDGEEYRQSLMHLPPIERERLMNGDWNVQERGQFRAEWLRYFIDDGGQMELLDANNKTLATIREEECFRFVTIDPAGTSEERAAEARGRTPSWSVVQVWDQPPREHSRFLLLRHQERERVEFAELCHLLRKARKEWNPKRMYVEGERMGAALRSNLKEEFALETLRLKNKGKVERAGPLILKMERGEVFLPQLNNSWRPKFEGELLAWTGKDQEPADQIDAAAHAARVAEERGGGVVRVMRVMG
jgi:phage terminase large subunit-like protein